MRALFFLTNDFVSTQTVLPILNDIRQAGYELTFCNLSRMHYFPLDDIIENSLNYFPIIDQNQDNIQCLSKGQYISACGDDIDFLECLTSLHYTNKYPLTEEYLFLDSLLYQRFYGFAFRVEQLMKAIAPALVFCWQGNNPFAKIIFCKAKKLHIPILNCETSFFPESYILDPWGMHFFPGWNLVDKQWAEAKNRPLEAEQEAALSQYLTTWKANKQSKYSQYNDIDEERMFFQLVNERKKILFFPGQVHDDASVMNGLTLFDRYEDILDFLRNNLPEDWLLVHKVHPYDQLKNLSAGRVGNTLILKNINIHDLISHADAVFTHSSTVGLEALVYGKPVICSGKPIYSNKGFTHDLASLDILQSLTDIATESLDTQLLDRFLYHIIFDYIIKNADTTHLRHRISVAIDMTDTVIDYPHSPFCHTYPHYAKEYIELARRMNDEPLDSYTKLFNFTQPLDRLDIDQAYSSLTKFYAISIEQPDLNKRLTLANDLTRIADILREKIANSEHSDLLKLQIQQLSAENQGLCNELLRAEAQLTLLKDILLNNLSGDTL
jgi:hypothetical protein